MYCLGHILTGFVHDCVVNYLDDDNPNAREAAALTCCILFANDPVCAQTSRNAIKTVEYVLDKLLTVAISDPGIYLHDIDFYSSLTKCQLTHCFSSHHRKVYSPYGVVIAQRTI